MTGLSHLLAASGRKASRTAARKEKITKAIQKHVPQASKEKVSKQVDKALAKPDAATKSDDALIAEIKAVVKGSFMVTSAIDRLITSQ